MREGWKQVTLGQVATQWVDGFSVDPDAEYVNLGVQWYAGGTFARDPKLGSEMKATRLFRVRTGQFIYNRMFVTEGSFALVAPEHAHGVVSNEFPVFDLDETRVLPQYLALHFQQRSTWAKIADQATGTTKSRRRWKEAQFLSYSIALPPLDTQRRVVDLLAAVDKAIEAAAGEAQILVDARRSMWRQVAVGAVRVDQVATVSQGRSLPKGIQGTTTGDIPWFKIADMTAPANIFGYTVAETSVSEEVLDECGGRKTPAGTVTFPRVGAAVATEKKRILDVDAALDENHIAVTPNVDGISEVLLAAFDSIKLGDLARSGAVPSLNMGLIRSLEIPWPAANETALSSLLASVRMAEKDALATAGSLRLLRSDLLTVLLSGEHEIPTSYDKLVGEAA